MMLPFRGIEPRRGLDVSRGGDDADIYFGAMAMKMLRDCGIFTMTAKETSLWLARQVVGRLERDLIELGVLRVGEITWSIELKGTALDIQVYRTPPALDSANVDLWIS